jgi:hypothetical protein
LSYLGYSARKYTGDNILKSLNVVVGTQDATITGMETKELRELIRLHEAALEVYKMYPQIWQKEIKDKVELIARLRKALNKEKEVGR